MKISVKYFLPRLSDVIQSNPVEVDFPGTTILDLLEHLTTAFGPIVREVLFDEHNQPDQLIQILLNGETWITHDQLDTPLKDGDSIHLMILMAGG